MSILVIAEHDNATCKISTRAAVSAAVKLGGDVHVLVAGFNAQAAADSAAKISGVAKVLLADANVYEHALAEAIAPLIVSLASGYSHIIAPSTTSGRNILPRAAALLDVQQISDVLSMISPDTFTRPIYAGNAIATVQSSDGLKVLTIRTTAFDPAPEGGAAAIEAISGPAHEKLPDFVGQELSVSARPELTAARVVVSGGRGMQSGENFVMLEKIADLLGGAVGASRAAVDAGFVPNDYQVGQTGKVVAPELYIAVGISGAIQHLAGMKDSKVIVAINKDADAPIFQVADYGLTGDLFEIVPQLTQALEKHKSP
jgi:electron transfer flavoprotein alpha subunit